MSIRKPDIMIKLEGHDEYGLFEFPNQVIVVHLSYRGFIIEILLKIIISMKLSMILTFEKYG